MKLRTAHNSPHKLLEPLALGQYCISLAFPELKIVNIPSRNYQREPCVVKINTAVVDVTSSQDNTICALV